MQFINQPYLKSSLVLPPSGTRGGDNRGAVVGGRGGGSGTAPPHKSITRQPPRSPRVPRVPRVLRIPNADPVGISLVQCTNFTALRAISHRQRRYFTATLRVARGGGRGTAPPRKSQPVNNRTSPLLRFPITSKACMESRRSLVWNPQLVAVWNHAEACMNSESSAGMYNFANKKGQPHAVAPPLYSSGT